MLENLLRRLRQLLLDSDTAGALNLVESAIGDLQMKDRADQDASARVKEQPSKPAEQDLELAAEEARQLIDKAKTFLQKVGKEIAFAEISKPTGAFVKDEKYVFVLDEDGMMLAHGENQDFIGLDFKSVKDLEGKSFIQEILDKAGKKGHGTVEYIWFHPLSRRYENKVVYFEKVNTVIICSGIYLG